MIKKSLISLVVAVVTLMAAAASASAIDYGHKDAYGCFIQANAQVICVDPPATNFGTISARCLNLVPKADLHGCDLTGFNLSPKLVAAKGQYGSYYSYTSLAGANLKGAILKNANLRGVNISGADLTSANLSGANLTEIYVPAASPYAAWTVKTSLVNSDIEKTVLTSVDLRTVNLSGIKSGGITGSGLLLPGGNSGNCIGPFTPSVTTGTRCVSFEREDWSLIKGYIVGPRVDLTGAILNDADLSKADLNNGVNFTKAHLTRAKFKGADIQGANFTGAILNSADLSSTWLTQAKFTDASMKSANLSSASGCTTVYMHIQWEGSGFNWPSPVVVSTVSRESSDCIKGWSSCGWEQGSSWGTPIPAMWRCGSTFLRADLTGANLSSVYLPEATFASANLTRATITGSAWNGKFNNANLTDATFGVSMYYGTLLGAKTTRAKITGPFVCTKMANGTTSSSPCPLHS